MTLPSLVAVGDAVQSRTRADRLLMLTIVALFVLVYVLPLGHRPLFIPDEVRYGEIPREMLESGDWVVPRLDGLRYFEKPPMGYWINAVSIGWLGESNFSVRLPSALAAGLTAILIFFMTRRAGSTRRIALLGSAIYLTFGEVYVIGAYGILDGFLALFITAGIFAFYRATADPDPSGGRRWAAVAGIAFGFAFLSKGLLGFAIPGLVLLPWLVWSRRLRVGMARFWPCAAVAILVVAPWALAIHLREGDFWRYFIWEEHIRRFMGEDAQHKESILFFLKLLPLLAMPWIFLLPATISGLRAARRNERLTDFLRLLWLWILLPFAFFSISSGKLASYILPCFAPLAALSAIGLSEYLQSGRSRLFDYGQSFVAVIFGLFLVALLVSQTTGFPEVLYGAQEGRGAVLFALASALVAFSSLCAVRFKAPGAKLTSSALCMIPLLAASQFAIPNSVIERKAPGPLLTRLSETLPRDVVIVSHSGAMRAANWYFERGDVYTTSSHGELEYGLSYPEGKARYLDPDAFRKLLDENAGKRDVLLICNRTCGDEYESALTRGARRYDYGLFHVWHLPK